MTKKPRKRFDTPNQEENKPKKKQYQRKKDILETVLPNLDTEGVDGIKEHEKNSVPQGINRNPVQIALDQAKVFKMLRRGYDVLQVAEALNLTVGQVTNDYKAAVKEFVKNNPYNANVEEVITLKLAEYAEVKREAWEQWERSKEPNERRAFERIKSPNFANPAEPFEKTIAKKFKDGRLGESNYLRIIMDCIKAERELLGLDPKQSVNLKGSIAGIDFDWDIFMDEVTKPGIRNEAEERIYEGLPRIEVKNENKEE